MRDSDLKKLQARLSDQVEAKRREELSGPCPACGNTPKLQIVPAPNEPCGECMRRLRIMYPDARITAIQVTGDSAKHYE
jgi:hypothetical protein